MSSDTKLIQLSRSLRKLKNEQAAVLKEQSRKSPPEKKLIIPGFPYPKNTFLQTAPWAFNGFLICYGTLKLVVDPGFEFLTRCLYSQIDPTACNSFFISHSHIDHTASINTMLKVMQYAGHEKAINIITSEKVIQDQAISRWLSDPQKNVQTQIIKDNISFKIHDVEIVPVKMFHSIDETYGFVLNTPTTKIGYITDTGYTKKFSVTNGQEKKLYEAGVDVYEEGEVTIEEKHEYIKEAYKEVDILICNVNDYIFTKHSKYHLTGYDVLDILKGSRVKKCFIAHLNASDLTGNQFLHEYEKTISSISGIETICFNKDNTIFHLN